MTFYIKNMVCSRCKMLVGDIFHRSGLHTTMVGLGEVTITEAEVAADTMSLVREELAKLGFEIIDDRKRRLTEKIKNAIVKLVHYEDQELSHNISGFIAGQLSYEYNYLSSIFSESEGITIEKYYIAQKIERVKELLTYDELTLSQIADKLGYSSVAYLSNQFKKETGLSPSFFKNLKQKNRRNLEDL